MFRTFMIVSTFAALLSACASSNHAPTAKTMVGVKEKAFHFGLTPLTQDIEPYAQSELSNGIKDIPLSLIEAVEIESNSATFQQSRAYKIVNMVFAQKGVDSEKISYLGFEDKKPKIVNISLFYKTIAYPEPCPDWSGNTTINHRNSPMSNMGCATTINIGHMLSRPDDLLFSRGDHRAVSESSIDAVSRYHRGDFVTLATDNSTAMGQE